MTTTPHDKWVMRDPLPSPQSLSELIEPTALPDPAVLHTAEALLKVRSVPSVVCDDLKGIMGIEHREMYDPAVIILLEAVYAGKKICVNYDYDCDGITAGAALVTTLKMLDAEVVSCVSSRLQDGYGLFTKVVQSVAPEPCLVVTVDTGVACKEAVDELNALGYEVLITDHHLFEGELPKALYVLNPKLYLRETDDEYMASGCYIAAKLGLLLFKRLNPDSDYPFNTDCYKLWQYLSCLTSLSIISDVIPLNPTMRMQLNLGMSELSIINHEGLRALCSTSNIYLNQPINSQRIAFYLAPKINSAGRMDNPQLAFNLLTTKTGSSSSAVLGLANSLKSFNTNRKVLEQAIFDEAVVQAEEYIKQYTHSLVVYQEDWHTGVIGIVAARLCERYGVPTIVLSKLPNGTITGSGRSPEYCSLIDCIAFCKRILVTYGGHKVACGLSLTENNLEEFKELFDRACNEPDMDKHINYTVDAAVSISVLQNVPFQHFITNFTPNGNGNPDLVFELNCVRVISVVRKGEQISITVQQDDDDDSDRMYITKYRPPVEWYNIPCGSLASFLVSPTVSYYTGYTSYEYKILDLMLMS